jgi:hypothetical protein
MEIELCCTRCSCRFQDDAKTSADDIIDRMCSEGSWFALGTGSTFEEMVGTALRARGMIRCPECQHPLVVVCEERAKSRRPRPGNMVQTNWA